MTDPAEPSHNVWMKETKAWARMFLADILLRWLEASGTETGLFQFHLDRQWQAREQAASTLVSQCRLIYNFARSYALFRDTRFLLAATHGLEALETYFRLASGGYRCAVKSDGAESDSSLDSYGHAFCILAQATAAEAFADKRFSVTTQPLLG